MALCLECNTPDVEKIVDSSGGIVYVCPNCKTLISNKKKSINQAINQESHLKNILKRTTTDQEAMETIAVIREQIKKAVGHRYTPQELQKKLQNPHYLFNYVVSNLTTVLHQDSKKVNSALITSILVNIASMNMNNTYEIKEKILILFNEYQIFFVQKDNQNKNNISYLEFIIIALSIINNHPLPETANKQLKDNSEGFKQYILNKYMNYNFEDNRPCTIQYVVPNPLAYVNPVWLP